MVDYDRALLGRSRAHAGYVEVLICPIEGERDSTTKLVGDGHGQPTDKSTAWRELGRISGVFVSETL